VNLVRLRAGEWLAAAAAVALLVSLALPWYGDLTGFEALSVIDVLLALAALLGLALAFLQATRESPAAPLAAAVLTVVAGLLGTLLVLFRLLDAPDDFETTYGVWLALAAILALTAGGWLSMANEHVRGLPPGPEPELRPSPRIADRAQP
jgi:drug/metabolite transporter (DMT)-like permease